MKNQFVLYDALKLETDAKAVESHVISAIIQSKIGASCYAFKSRVKPEDRLVEKLERKQKTKPNYQLTDIKDVIGLRLVTLFRKEMPEILDSVLALINHDINLHPNPFVKNSLEELIIYSTNPTHDQIAHKITTILNGKNITYSLDNSNSAYSSVHIVARVNKETTVKHLAKNINIPIEIQIRTVFEDAWGEVDHRFGYVIRTGKEAGKPVANAAMVQEHLNVLKKFSDACGEYADLIYSEAAPKDKQPAIEGKVISVGSDAELLLRFKEMALPEMYINAYTDGRQVRENALHLLAADVPQGRIQLIKAADFFKRLAEDAVSDSGLQSDTAKLFNYYVRMNEGFCLMSTAERSGIQLAARIYANLEDEYPDYPLVKFRFGQALGKLGDSESAIAKFKETRESMALLNQEGVQQQNDKLPKDDREHIERLLPKLLGFQLWVSAEKNIDALERERLLLQAFQETKPLLEKLPEDISAHNNLLYYAVEYLRVAEHAPEDMRRQLDASLKFLEKKNIAETTTDIELLDTFLRAYDFLSRGPEAQRVASRILELWKTGGADINLLDTNIVLEIVKFAFSICKED